jgi:hypothetical protein
VSSKSDEHDDDYEHLGKRDLGLGLNFCFVIGVERTTSYTLGFALGAHMCRGKERV